MSVIDYIIIALGLVMAIVFQFKCYEKLSNKKMVLGSFKKILCIILTLIIMTIDIYVNLSFSSLLFSFILTFLSNYIIFKDSLKECFIRSLIFFIIMASSEILLSFVIYLIPFNTSFEYDVSSIIKVSISFVVYLVTYLIICFKWVSKFTNIIIYKIKTELILLVSLIYLLVLIFQYKKNFNTNYDYLINVFLLLVLLFLLIVAFYNMYRNEISKQRHIVLLDFLSNYEKLIDEHRMKLHEVQNDFIILKSYKNKNSKIYNNILDDFINKYNKSGISYKNVYNLPCGLKGMLYYKLYDMKLNGIEAQLFISKNIKDELDNIINEDYAIITKVLAILLDNALDAAIKSNNKVINIEFYNDKGKINIRIENSFDNKNIDFNKIYNKKYSSNGSLRGYGLYILKNIINKSDTLDLEQFIDNDYFVSILGIENKK